MKKPLYCLSLLLLSIVACKEKDPDHLLPVSDKTIMGILPKTFDWETVDWMPTPPSQEKIPPPWIGQGSITSVYGIEVANDHKKSDGWVMMYSSFDATASAPIPNPYFILYNYPRGIMRIYYFVTTEVGGPSTYLVDGLYLATTRSSSMFNFLTGEIVDPTKTTNGYTQIEPAPADGSQPLGARKWYMLQYEIAYDPNITSLTANDMQLSWFLNYNSVAQISLGGELTGTVKSNVGAPGSKLPDALKSGAETVGKGILALTGSAILKNNGDTSGTNSLGLGKDHYKNLYKALTSTVSAAEGNIPAAIVGIFSAIFGGNSGSQAVNLTVDADIKLTGTLTDHGSFPSSPASLYVPGTTIPSSAQNYIPLFNWPIGLYNFKARPVMDVYFFGPIGANMPADPDEVWFVVHSTAPENQILVTNPAIIYNGIGSLDLFNFSEEPVFILSDTATDTHLPRPIIEKLVSGAQWEAKGPYKVITSTDILPDTDKSFYIRSADLREELEWAIVGNPAVDHFKDMNVRVRFNVRGTDHEPWTITHVKTVRANIRLHQIMDDRSEVVKLITPAD